MLSTRKSKRRAVLSILLLITGLVSATLVYRTRAYNTKQNRGQGKRVPLTVLQSSEPMIRTDYATRTLLARSKDGRSLYSLDAMTGELLVHEKNGTPSKKAANSFLNVEAFAVGPQDELYLAGKDSTVRIVGSDGRRLKAFHTVYPKSIAVLSNGNVVVASPFDGKNLHLYNDQGILLASFSDMRPFDANLAENDFLNEGRVVVGPDDQIYYVSTYAPQPHVLRFSSEGALLGEFPIEGEAVDLQTGFTREFLNRRGFCSGGVTIITSANVSPETGHLWLGMNSLSTQGTVYEYDQAGIKVREFAFLINADNKRKNVTHVKDVVVSGDSLSILTMGGTYGFTLSDVLIADAWKVPIETSKTIKPAWSVWANPLAAIAKFWAPAPVIRPGIPQPVQSSCPPPQDYTCIANCPQGTVPNPADCGAVITGFFPTNQSKRVIEKNSCSAKQIDSAPGSSTPGGCTETVTWCDNASPNVTGSTTVNVNCTAVPTPTPTPTPTTSGGGGGRDIGFCCVPTGDGFECCGTPILIDVSGNGFKLTNAAAGVNFDLDSNGTRERRAWTNAGTDDAWLALDRNGNGAIDDGSELFGNFTPQPDPPVGQERHGFLALAEYDRPTNGGNGDGLITSSDTIFASLRLWQDRNHNGISEAAELISLQGAGLKTIELDYKESRKQDEYGNSFRYRAKVKDQQGSQVSRWAWDVFLVTR